MSAGSSGRPRFACRAVERPHRPASAPSPAITMIADPLLSADSLRDKVLSRCAS